MDDKNSKIIGGIIAILTSANMLVFTLTGWTPFADGQIVAIVNGFSVLVVVGIAWWNKYRNLQLQTENAELKTALVALGRKTSPF